MPADADRFGARATPPSPVPKKNSVGPHFTKRTTCPQQAQNICRAKNAKAKKEWVNERIPSNTQKAVRNTSVAMLILFLLRSWHAANTLFLSISAKYHLHRAPADQHIAPTDQPSLPLHSHDLCLRHTPPSLPALPARGLCLK